MTMASGSGDENKARIGKEVKGMQSTRISIVPESLDRGQFDRAYTVKALRMQKQCCSKYMKLLKGLVLARPKVKAVVTDKLDPSKRILLLDEHVSGLEDARIPDEIRKSLREDQCEEVDHQMKEDYSILSTESVLKRILPEDCEVPGSFETVGHIAHLNLKPEQLPYKHIIGQVIMDKNSFISTVVNKVGILENEFRVLPLEVIAGEDRLEATVHQHKTRFKLHFGEVYWNSRLEEEHTRLTKQFKAGEIIADVMAGVGPFTVPAAQHGCQVYANDLNPRSYHYLQENSKLNKVTNKIHASQLDGRQFIRMMGGSDSSQATLAHTEISPTENGAAARDIETCNGNSESQSESHNIPSGGVIYHHAIMNLPATAVEFLDAFSGSFSHDLWRDKELPLVHVYTFARSAETDADIRSRVEHHLGSSVNEKDLRIRLVRDVAPNKRMMCITFRVPSSVAFSRSSTSNDLAEVHADKKAKLG